jgi:hypothetical protein
MRKPKRPRDPNQLAKSIVDLATGEKTEALPADTRNPAAVALGRLGGLKGGKARAKALTPAKRSEIALRAAQKRWSLRKKQK